MFKRRDPHSFLATIRQFFWPDMGWQRMFTYIKHRLLRIADTTHSIALGLAIGLGISFTPLVGTHFIQAGLLAFAFRGNALAAMIGTFVGNPWTFPFFWWAGFSSGSFLFNLLGLKGAENLPENTTLTAMWNVFVTRPWDLFLPWMLGGYLLAVVSIPAAYYVYYRLIETAKAARKKTMVRRAKREQEK